MSVGTMQSEEAIREQLFKIRQLIEHVPLDEDEAPWLMQAEAILAWVLGENSMNLFLVDSRHSIERPSSPLDAATLEQTRRVFRKNGRIKERFVENPAECRCGWAAAETMEKASA